MIIHLSRDGAGIGSDHVSEAGIGFEQGDLILHNGGSIGELHARIDDLLMDIAA